MSRVIALLTDFGLADVYVGVMKGVIQTICPQAVCIDISHSIQPQNIRQGAFALLNAVEYFPAGTVFLVVVDPGVGSLRQPVAVQAGEYYLVGPDNGVLSYVLADFPAKQIVRLDNTAYQLGQPSRTFHGRDIFAPAAAHIACGVKLVALGTGINGLNELPQPELSIGHKAITGEILHIDHFGNIITSIGRLRWADNEYVDFAPRSGDNRHSRRLDAGQLSVCIGDHVLGGIVPMYSQRQPGELLATIDSSGYLEVAINQGHAAQRLGAALGDVVEVKLR